MTGHGASPLHDFYSSDSEHATPSSQTSGNVDQETRSTIRAPDHGHTCGVSGLEEVRSEGRRRDTSCTLDAPSQPAWLQPIQPKYLHTSTTQWLREIDRETFTIPAERLPKCRKKKPRNSSRTANNSQLSGTPQVIKPPAASRVPVNPFKVENPRIATALPSLHAFMAARREKGPGLQDPQQTAPTVQSRQDSTPLNENWDVEFGHATAPAPTLLAEVCPSGVWQS